MHVRCRSHTSTIGRVGPGNVILFVPVTMYAGTAERKLFLKFSCVRPYDPIY